MVIGAEPHTASWKPTSGHTLMKKMFFPGQQLAPVKSSSRDRAKRRPVPSVSEAFSALYRDHRCYRFMSETAMPCLGDSVA